MHNFVVCFIVGHSALLVGALPRWMLDAPLNLRHKNFVYANGAWFSGLTSLLVVMVHYEVFAVCALLVRVWRMILKFSQRLPQQLGNQLLAMFQMRKS